MQTFRSFFTKAAAGTAAAGTATAGTAAASTAVATSQAMSSVCATGEMMPAVFVNHGGGPMPVLGQQPEVKDFLGEYGAKFAGKLPRAIVVVTAHWEASQVMVSTGASHSLLYDYGGFPAESYRLQYPAPGEPAVANEALELLKAAGIEAKGDSKRSWDHGVFIPMMCMFPKAEVPVVQISLVAGQDAKKHWDIGVALQPLRERGCLIVGSGLSFHNFKYFFAHDRKTQQDGFHHSSTFTKWLNESVADPDLKPEERMTRLVRWQSAPSASECHPRGGAEHFMPFFVVAGSAKGKPGKAVGEKYGKMMGTVVGQYEF